jgi:chloramphenicol 3-O phosphotransferase
MKTKSGTIIILNGTSVAGKTSIQKELQRKLTLPYLTMGIDSILVAMLPQRYFLGLERDRKEVLWGEPSEDKEGNPLFHLYFGEKGRQVILGMHDAIAVFAKNGNNVIVDYIQYEKEWGEHLKESLKSLNYYLIGVKIPLHDLEERERQRNTSPKGHARSHFEVVHSGMNYDFEVDTSIDSPEECANKIISFIEKKEK